MVVHLGTVADCFIASSVNKGLKKRYSDSCISWVVDNNEANLLISSSKNVDNVYSLAKVADKTFDLLINLSCVEDAVFDVSLIPATSRVGFVFGHEDQKYYSCLYGDSVIDMNLFQIYYRLAGMSWRGEGYDICYNPRSRMHKSRVGLAIVNANLRTFVTDHLNLEQSKLWVVPYKKNLLRRMDEINRCKEIVTDDLLTLHIALYLRKFVYFLRAVPLTTNIEIFNSGQVYDVPLRYLR